MRVAFTIGIWAALSLSAAAADLDRMEEPPAGWTGPVFEPSFAFPSTTTNEPRPWEAIDFKTAPADYMAVVLAYVLEGQDLDTWRVQDNSVRNWYHVPWMGPGGKGREFIRGLTRERSLGAGDLGEGPDGCRQTWAVGFYNPPGGFTLGQVWKPVSDGTGGPDFSKLPFAAGTVVAKLLYTEASADEVPMLVGSPEIQANINIDGDLSDDECPADNINNVPTPRTPKTMRLVQLDVGVRDPDADDTTGWVFGTFVYDASQSGSDPWAKLVPVGLMWGNDFELSDDDAAGGEAPEESIVMTDLGIGRDFGRGGRMNGPVDNPVSACLSCHMTAQWPNPARITPGGSNWDSRSCWFRNIGPTTPFGRAPNAQHACGDAVPNQVSLDYSLQLIVARRNWQAASATILLESMGRVAPNAIPVPALDEAILDIDGVKSLPVHR